MAGSSSGHVIACFEVERLGDGSARVVLSMPGRDGTVARKFQARDGFLDEAQLASLRAWVGQSVLDAVAPYGVQGRLYRDAYGELGVTGG